MNESNELLDVVTTRDIKKAAYLITNGANLNQTDAWGKTALHIAVEIQNAEAVELLLNQDRINVDAVEEDGLTPLMYASKKPNLKIIQMLLQHGCSIHQTARSLYGRTAIHFAVEGSSLEVIKLLIENGADLNTQDSELNTALHIAMQRRDLEILAMLLYYNVDTSISNVFGPPIQEAKTPEIRELLLPYTDLCNEDVLASLDTTTMKLLWQTYQSKGVFAQWLLEDIQTRMRFLFGIYNLSRRQFCEFLHKLYEDEEMYEVMYHPETSACLLELVPFNTGRNIPEEVTADMLRLLLCNCNVLGSRAVIALQQKLDYAPVIIKVFEDLDVVIEEHVYKHSFVAVAEPAPWPILWRMFCTPRVDLEAQLLQSSNNEVVKRFFAVGKTASLLELCRNKIRDTILSREYKTNKAKPFHYATVLKPLEIPRVLLDVLMLRKRVY